MKKLWNKHKQKLVLVVALLIILAMVIGPIAMFFM